MKTELPSPRSGPQRPPQSTMKPDTGFTLIGGFKSKAARRCATLGALGSLGALGCISGWERLFGLFGLFGFIGVAYIVEAVHRFTRQWVARHR